MLDFPIRGKAFDFFPKSDRLPIRPARQTSSMYVMSKAKESSAWTREIYSALSKKDALLIFELAAAGIAASNSIMEKYHLSKKRYYTRLRKLIRLGLVSKMSGTYRQTALGAMVYENQVRMLQNILTRKESFEILDDLRQRNKPDDGLMNAIHDLSRDVLKDARSTDDLPDLKHKSN